MRETKPTVELARLGLERAGEHLDAGSRQAGGALAGDERIGIAHRHHDPADAGGDERIGALAACGHGASTARG
jgi:hypothetical protein